MLLLLLVKSSRDLDHGRENEISAAVGVIYIRNSLAFERKLRAALRSLGNGIFHIAIQQWNADLGPQRCLGHRDRHLTVNVVAVTLKELVAANRDREDQISRRSSVSPSTFTL